MSRHNQPVQMPTDKDGGLPEVGDISQKFLKMDLETKMFGPQGRVVEETFGQDRTQKKTGVMATSSSL